MGDNQIPNGDSSSDHITQHWTRRKCRLVCHNQSGKIDKRSVELWPVEIESDVALIQMNNETVDGAENEAVVPIKPSRYLPKQVCLQTFS